jgi:ubiquitin C-terminal hydrolase
LGSLEKGLFDALLAVFHTHRPSLVHAFFNQIKDFNGRDNRYGQIAVPDFLDYLCTQVPKVDVALGLHYFTRLQCSECKWIHEVPSHDPSLKLYVPEDCKQTSLSNLVEHSSSSVLRGSEAVICGKCERKTEHTSSRLYDPDLIMMEIIRVTKVKRRWVKNNVAVSFPCSDLALPGFPRKYKVISSCNHRGSITAGHWFTKELTESGWYELDDLKTKSVTTQPPGANDKSVVMVLMIAEDKFVP